MSLYVSLVTHINLLCATQKKRQHMKKDLTIFLCSTQADLRPEREVVLEAIRRLQLQHDSMEFFGARENAPLETCLEEVRRSDILVVIIGHRYGTFIPNQTISYSEAEYREGIRLGKPCLIYFRNDDIPILPRFVERNPKGLEALTNLKEHLQERHTIAYFNDANDLAIGVVADLSRTVQAIEESAKLEAEDLGSQPDVSITHKLTEIANDALNSGIAEDILYGEIRNVVKQLLKNSGYQKPKVFLSYTSKDKNIVKAFSEVLRSKEVEPWIDEEQIMAGHSILENVSKSLQNSDCLALFMSSSSMKSQWVRQELNIVMASRLSAKKDGPIIIPILLENIDIPAILRDVKYIDLRDGDFQRAGQECYQAIQRHLNLDDVSSTKNLTNFHTVEKGIHALRSLLHARFMNQEDNQPGSGKRSLENGIEDLAKVVGGLCGLTTRPVNRLQEFVNLVISAKQGNDLPKIFHLMPELRQFLVFPNFDSSDINN